MNTGMGERLTWYDEYGLGRTMRELQLDVVRRRIEWG